jgi:hypothetical protein
VCQGKTHRSILIFADILGIGSLTFVTEPDPPEHRMVTDVPANHPQRQPNTLRKTLDSYQGMAFRHTLGPVNGFRLQPQREREACYFGRFGA